MIGKKAFMGAKAFAKRHYSGAIKSMKELKAPAKKYAKMSKKHLMKHKGKYAAAVAGGAGMGIYSASKNNNKG